MVEREPKVKSKQATTEQPENQLPIRVVIADDHEGVRKSIRSIIEETSIVTIIGESGDGHSTIKLIERLFPDVLLLDIEMPGMNGIDVARHLGRHGPNIPILGISSHDGREYISILMRHGIKGYIVKDEVPDLLIDAIRKVYDGKSGWFSDRNDRSSLV